MFLPWQVVKWESESIHAEQFLQTWRKNFLLTHNRMGKKASAHNSFLRYSTTLNQCCLQFWATFSCTQCHSCAIHLQGPYSSTTLWNSSAFTTLAAALFKYCFCHSPHNIYNWSICTPLCKYLSLELRYSITCCSDSLQGFNFKSRQMSQKQWKTRCLIKQPLYNVLQVF